MPAPSPSYRLRLGRGGLFYVTVSGLILAAAIYTQANLLFWAFGLTVGGLLISVLLAWQMLRDLEVQRLLPGQGVAGEPVVLRYHLNNRCWLPGFGLLIRERWGRRSAEDPIRSDPPRLLAPPHGFVLHVAPHGAIQGEAPCYPLLRGLLTFERVEVSSSFPFNVVQKVVRVEQPGHLLVLPHLYRMNRRLLHTIAGIDASGRNHIERGGGDEEFFGLREYRSGDPLKRIDWKRTARSDAVIVRELTQPSPPKVMVLLDLTAPADEVVGEPTISVLQRLFTRRGRRPAGRSEEVLTPRQVAVERAISLCASVICDSYLQGHQVGLTVVGADCGPFPLHHSLPHRTRLLEALARLPFEPDPTLRPTVDAHPSVVIVPGHIAEAKWSTHGPQPMVLSAAELEQHVTEGDRETLLSRTVRAASRRSDLVER